MSDPSPAIILVEPQLPQNIGMAARAMANFGLRSLRLVQPRDGWPNPAARGAAAAATRVLDEAVLYPSLEAALADLGAVFATTARPRDQMKRVLAPDAALVEVAGRCGRGERVGIVFGRERTGLDNDEVSIADAIISFPVDPAYSSLNLAQSVLLVAYEWQRASRGGEAPFASVSTPPADRASVLGLFAHIEAELDAALFYPPDKRPTMTRNMRDMFLRMGLTEQDVRTWRGAIRALADNRPRRS